MTDANLKSLLKQAGYKSGTKYHVPTKEKFEEKVCRLEDLIILAGHERYKTTGNEYEYAYDIGKQRIVFNYRWGEFGLQAWWLQDIEE